MRKQILGNMLKTHTLFAFALLAPLRAAEDASKLPPAIQAIVDRAEDHVYENRKAYDKANAKSLDAAEKALKTELVKMTKASKLDEAMAAKKILESLRADVVARVDERAHDNGALLSDDAQSPQKVLAAKLCATRWLHLGRWNYEFKPDGTYVLVGTKRHGIFDISKDGETFTLTWISDNNMKEIGRATKNGLIFCGNPLVPVK